MKEVLTQITVQENNTRIAFYTRFVCRDQIHEYHDLSKGWFLNDTSAPPHAHEIRQQHRRAKANELQEAECMKPNGKTSTSV